MSTNPISLFNSSKFVSQLYSLAGPQENLPSLLMELLDNDELTVRNKLQGKSTFTSEDVVKITEKFNSSALHHQMIA